MAGSQLRYAILHHEGVGEPHFDLLFETAPGSSLVSFRCVQWPVTQRQSLEKLPDHRSIYLEYEGKISNNRGHVRRVEGGTYSRREIDDFESEFVLENPGGIRRVIFTQMTRGWPAKFPAGCQIRPA